LGRPPSVNDEAVYNDDVIFKVLDVDRRAVARVRIEYPVSNLSKKDEDVDSSTVHKSVEDR
jgi:CBS domain containing-hemolysin-like protein